MFTVLLMTGLVKVLVKGVAMGAAMDWTPTLIIRLSEVFVVFVLQRVIGRLLERYVTEKTAGACSSTADVSKIDLRNLKNDLIALR